jgi:hypothetical protein
MRLPVALEGLVRSHQSPTTRDDSLWRLPQQPDSLAEQSEFELPVPVSKLPYNSTYSTLSDRDGCEALLPRTAFLMLSVANC